MYAFKLALLFTHFQRFNHEFICLFCIHNIWDYLWRNLCIIVQLLYQNFHFYSIVYKFNTIDSRLPLLDNYQAIFRKLILNWIEYVFLYISDETIAETTTSGPTTTSSAATTTYTTTTITTTTTTSTSTTTTTTTTPIREGKNILNSQS